MAITEHAVRASWDTQVASNSRNIGALPGTPAAGDRTFIFAAWKDFSVSMTSVQSNSGARVYTEITQFADGSVGVGNGTGSMKVGGWYTDWQSGDSDPTCNWSANVDIAGIISVILRKDSSDTWNTPTFVTGAITTAANPFTSTSTSTITIDDGALVQEIIGIRDDSATMTRSATTALSDDGSPAVTWNGNVVESPATHLSTTLGNDMAADRIYRLVTTGASGVNLTATGTLSATETGTVLWVHQSVTVAADTRVPYYKPYTQLLAH